MLTCTAHFANLSGSDSPKNTMSAGEKSKVKYRDCGQAWPGLTWFD